MLVAWETSGQADQLDHASQVLRVVGAFTTLSVSGKNGRVADKVGYLHIGCGHAASLSVIRMLTDTLAPVNWLSCGPSQRQAMPARESRSDVNSFILSSRPSTYCGLIIPESPLPN